MYVTSHYLGSDHSPSRVEENHCLVKGFNTTKPSKHLSKHKKVEKVSRVERGKEIFR